MKKILCLAAGLLALNLTPVFGQALTPEQQIAQLEANRLKTVGQSAVTPPPPLFSPQRQPLYMPRLVRPLGVADEQPALTKFNLDFPGGTPKQLVAAIEKALGKSLNVIVPTDEKTAKVMLPPIKVNDMDVARLFKALEENKYDEQRSDYIKRVAFYTEDKTPSDNSLWQFVYYVKPSALTVFSLDFPGGTPAQLVKAIEKAMGKPLNVIINKEDENVDLPALKMNDVYLPQLFSALETASRKTVLVSNSGPYGMGSYSQFSAGYGFKTADTITDTSVWYFHVEKPGVPPVVSIQKTCQYYSLALYLDRGFTVDDITTAIQTGWKMSGETSLPELNYHKETKMLIAYGEPNKLKTIDDVLKTLPQSQYSLPTMESHIKQLQSEVDLLEKRRQETALLLNKLSSQTVAPAIAPEEKSGK